MALAGAHVPAQLPTISVTSGRSCPARFVAQRYHVRHSPRAWSQVRGMQLTLTNGITTQLSLWAMSRSVGIHICACESPITAITLELLWSPSRQTRLLVWPVPDVQPFGNL